MENCNRKIFDIVIGNSEQYEKNIDNLIGISNEVRNLVIEAAWKSKSAHVGSSLSCVDLLVSLYFHKLKVDENNWNYRDIFVLSKAHAAMALYAVLTKGSTSRLGRLLVKSYAFCKFIQN